MLETFLHAATCPRSFVLFGLFHRMQDPNTLTIATSLPVQITPSTAEIVFCSETNSYALSLGVRVQLPIPELVDLLLKFNATQSASKPVVDDESHISHSLLASLPEASPFSVPESFVYTPKNGVHADVKRSCQASSSCEYAEDDFARIPIHVARQDPFLLEYKERSMWRAESGRFFRACHVEKQGDLVNKEARAYEIYDQLSVNEHFLYMMNPPVSESSETGLPPATSFSRPPSTKLSADAPVFTPGSAFASTQGSDNGAVRQRAMSGDTHSEKLARPPRVVEEAPVESPNKQLASFWAKVVSSQAVLDPADVEEKVDAAECKQM